MNSGKRVSSVALIDLQITSEKDLEFAIHEHLPAVYNVWSVC